MRLYSSSTGNIMEPLSSSIELSIQPIASKVFSLEANCIVDFEGRRGGHGYGTGPSKVGRKSSLQEPTSKLPMPSTIQHCQRYYSEGVLVARNGPTRQVRFKSHVQYSGDRHYKHTVFFERKMVPYTYCSTLIVNDQSDHPDLVDSIEQKSDTEMEGPSANLGTVIKYFEQVCLKPKTIISRRAETVYNYPKEVAQRFSAKSLFHQDRKQQSFISGLRVTTPSNIMVIELPMELLFLDILDPKAEVIVTNGSQKLPESDCTHHKPDDTETYNETNNNYSAKTVYSSMKEIMLP